MKIAQICPYNVDRAGGVQHHMRSLANELTARGHETVIVAPGPKPANAAPDVIYVGRQHRVSWSGTQFEMSWAGRGELRALTARLTAWGVDVLHFHTIWVPAMPMQLFARRGAAAVATFHETPPDTLSGRMWRQVYHRWSRWLLDRLDGAVAVSAGPNGYLRPGPKGVRPALLPPAVDLSRFAAIRHQPAQGADAPVRVLFVGRLEPRKGVDVLLDAWGRLSARSGHERALTLTIAGYGDLKPMVVAAQARFGPDNVDFVEAPSQDGLLRLLAAADMLVAPSPFGESFGIVLVEALAAGLPVIAADNQGYATVMTGEGRACLVPAGDAGALAAAIKVLADDPEKRRMLAAWGRRHAAQYDIAQVAEGFEGVYAEAVRRYQQRRGTSGTAG